MAYRISYLNLTDAGVQGGRVVDHTLGLTWYLNPYARLMLNLVHSETTDRRNPAGGVFDRGIANMFETRVQMTF